MSTVSLTQVTLCPLDDIPLGLGRAFRVGDASVAVFRSRHGRVLAVENRCPHRGGPLADGMLVGDQIVCPMHAFRFHGETGECEQPGVCPVATYAAEVVAGRVVLGLPDCRTPA